MIEFIKSKLPWIVSAVLLFLLFVKSCVRENIEGVNTITSDTIYIPKVIRIPEIKQVFVNTTPKEKGKSVVKGDTIRTYENKYIDSTGLAEVTISDSVNGKLLNQKVKIHVKEQEVKYEEKIITNTTKLKPSFVISGGLTTQIGVNPSVGMELSFKNKSGYTLDLGVNNRKDFTIGVKKDLFTYWNNKK